MAIESGASLGPYKILEPLGEGGMGEVYLAEDTRLGRKVAIKVLPPAFATDADRLARFEQEARAAAALNHPNIAAVHDIGSQALGDEPAPIRYIVQEYLEGETLRQVVNRGPLPLKKALQYTSEISEALVVAHKAGIVHRDLKPENIFVTQDGHMKVLDFGLAKLTEADSGGPSSGSMSPTVTMAGQILGTAGYMAPEQVRGEPVDQQADLFALGCVVYEMLAGRRAFGGGNVHEVLSRILGQEPTRVETLTSGMPLKVTWMVDKSLAKDRELRYQSASDMLVDLRVLSADLARGAEGIATGGSTTGPSEESKETGVSWLSTGLGALVLVLASITGTWYLAGPEVPEQDLGLIRFSLQMHEENGLSGTFNRTIAMSPDGRYIALMLEAGIELRSLDSLERQRIHSELGRAPAFSPDNRQLAVWTAGHINRIPITGGAAALIGDNKERPFGLTWADDGYIYVGRGADGLWRMAEQGNSTPQQVVEVDEGLFAHGPELLPGDEWLLFTISTGVSGWNNAQIVAQNLSTDERRVLIESGREVRYSPTGHLVYVSSGLLHAAPFNAATVTVEGSPVSLLARVRTSTRNATGAANFDISDKGDLVYWPDVMGETQGYPVLSMNRDGDVEHLPLPDRAYDTVRLSPDGRRIAAETYHTDGSKIWLYQIDRESGQLLTTEGTNRSPVWSPDGEWIYFASNQNGDFDIFRRRTDLSGEIELVHDSTENHIPASMPDDGSSLYVYDLKPSAADIYRLSLSDSGGMEPIVDSDADEFNPTVSPDGRFLAFQTNEGGDDWTVMVMDLVSKRRWVASGRGGGFSPIWSRDGNRIVYLTGVSALYVDVTTSPDFSSTEPQAAFERINTQGYDISTDGSQAFFSQNPFSWAHTQIDVVLNWDKELGKAR